MKKEIEIKYYLGNSKDLIVKKMNDYKFELVNQETQIDTYYTSKHKDFIKSEECLRIREYNNKIELTWKPPTTVSMASEKQYWKEELNIQIIDNKEKIMRLLMVLDFVEYITVDKNRTNYKYDEETTISIDFIKDVGYFLEIETLSRNEKESISKNISIANLLQLVESSIVNIPYRDIVRNNKTERPT